jgi:hypothetical protein
MNLTAFHHKALPIAPQKDESWMIATPAEQRIKAKIERIGKPLKEWNIQINYGIKTGYNEAFIIDGKKKDELIAQDPRSAEIIKPILRGRDIKRYKAEFADLWLIYIPWHFPLHKDQSINGASEKAEREFEKQYPAIYKHLLEHKEKLSARNKAETGIRYEWYALQRWASDYYHEFEKEKIVWQEMSQDPSFAFDEKSMYCNDTGRILVGSFMKYFLGFFNSTFFKFSFSKWYAGGGLGDKGIRFKSEFMKEYPIPLTIPSNDSIVKQIEELVDKILEAKKQNPTVDTAEWEREINELVYRLYDLTEEEIAIVEGKR